MKRRNFIYRTLLAVSTAASCGAAALGAPADLDLPGTEVQPREPDPSPLQPLLPPFSAVALEQDPDAEGWDALRLSPSGRYFFAEVRAGERRSVLLFEGDGKLIRDLTRDVAPFASAAWGASDQQLLLECREKPNQRPRFMTCNPATGAVTASPRGGLPEWALGGKDYLLALATAERGPGKTDGFSGFQRYTATHDPIGRPLAAEEPVWSGDGQWLAYLAASAPGSEPAPAASLQEVRVLPARGDVPRVVISRGGWDRLAREQGWQHASGPDGLAWAPAGDALFCLCTARTELDGQRFLVRLDVRTPRREVLAVPEDTVLISASADARHWLVRLAGRLYRLDFKTPPAKKRAAGPATALR